MGKIIPKIDELAEVIFRLMPKREMKKYEVVIFDKKLSLKDQFIARCNINWKVPKYSEEKSKEIFLKIMEKNNAKGGEFNLSSLDVLTENYLNLIYGKESKKSRSK